MDAAVGKGKIGGIGNRATRPTSPVDRIAKQDRTRDIIVARLDQLPVSENNPLFYLAVLGSQEFLASG
jgi:hypothetical protein